MDDEGLRARKKRDTRLRIAMTAMEQFAARGFDAVTVAEIARAADVSEKTVFNYFPTKEGLALARLESRIDALVTAVRELPAGESIVDVFRDLTSGFLSIAEHEPVEGTLVLHRLVRSSRALQDRMHLVWEEEAARLTPAVAEVLGADPGDLAPAVVTRALTAAHRTVLHAAVARLLDGEEPAAVVRDMREQADRVYDRLADGLGRP